MDWESGVMNTLRKLAVVVVALAGVSLAQADLIEFDLDHTLGPLRGDFGDGQSISDHAEFFPDRPITVSTGDTLIFNILFDHRLQVFDFGEPTKEVFTFGLQCVDRCAYGGTYRTSIEALGGRGNIWSDPIFASFDASGIGFGWGGVGLDVTDSQGSFTGIRWTTTFTSFREGEPLTVSAFSGFSGRADGFRLLPLPEPSTLALFSIGLAGMGLARRRRHL
jgi:hypothetical protein